MPGAHPNGGDGGHGGFVAADEASHPCAGGRWGELWWFGGTDGDGTGLFTTYGTVPSAGRSWYVAALVRPDHPLVLVTDHEIGWRDGQLSLRRPGLWADHVCEAPFEQWTVANEAHAVALEQPEDAIGNGYGVQTAVAFDVEWYAAGPAEPAVPWRTDGAGARSVGEMPAGYGQRGELDAVVELPGGPITFAGPANRLHVWGDLSLVASAPTAGDPGTVGARAGAGSPTDVIVPVAWPLAGGVLVVEHRLTRAGWQLGLRPGAS